MAIYYKHIKGCPEGTINENRFTYINWGDKGTRPSLQVNYIDDKQQTNKVIDYGYLLTERGGGTVEGDWKFPSTGINIGSIKISDETDQLVIDKQIKSNGFQGELTGDVKGNVTGELESLNLNTFNKEIIGDWNFENLFSTNGTIESAKANFSGDSGPLGNGECRATFFNATSDKRAKENIKPVSFDALKLVKNLNVYEFNYKDNKNIPTIGILAQDLLEKQPDHISFVTNENATGKDGDYMSIREDKLIFVLMQAIKQQQEEIESLKKEIQLLK